MKTYEPFKIRASQNGGYIVSNFESSDCLREYNIHTFNDFLGMFRYLSDQMNFDTEYTAAKVTSDINPKDLEKEYDSFWKVILAGMRRGF